MLTQGTNQFQGLAPFSLAFVQNYSRYGMVLAFIAKFTLDLDVMTPGANSDLHTVESTFKPLN